MKMRAVVATAVVVGGFVLVAPAHAQQTRPLAEGPVMALLPGGSFLSIVSLPQPPGASFGPHGHVPGFVYALTDNVTVTDDDFTLELKEGEAHFTPALAVHTHKNSDNRVPAGGLAIGLVVAAAVLLLVGGSRGAPGALVPGLLVVIIAGGALALWNPWKNDWFFYGIRPESARGAVMPLPGASRTYESPTFSNVPAGPYVESLTTITLDPRGEMESAEAAPGPVVFLVTDGAAEVTVENDEPVRLDNHEATLVQAGDTYRVVNPGGDDLRLLRFALTPEA